MTNSSKRLMHIALFAVAAAATASTAAAGSATAGDERVTRVVEWEEAIDEKTSVRIAAELRYEGLEPPTAGSPEEEKAMTRVRTLGRTLLLGVLDDCIRTGTVFLPPECFLIIDHDGLFETTHEWHCPRGT